MSEITRDVLTIVQEINQIKAEVRDTAIRGAIEIGKRLLEAKSLVPYGSWGQWLEDNVAYSERTAQDLMRIAKEYGRKETQALAEIQNKEQAVLLLALDADERDRFVQEHDMASMSTRQLQEELEQIKAERDKAQLTIEELMGQLGYVEAGESEGNAAAADTPHQSAEPTASPQGEALRAEIEAERRRAADLEKSLKEARKQVAETEERRQKDVEREKKKAREAAESRDKMSQMLAEKNQKADEQAKTIKRMEDELTEAREKVRTVEIVPEAVEQELNRLRAQASRSNAESNMRAAFDAFKGAYERLMGKLMDAEGGSEEEAETARKYRAAFKKATVMMAERM